MLRIAAILALSASMASAKTPNVILFFVDDMGYGDVGCYGAKGWKTPVLDKLATEGMRFTDFHVAQPVCSASRAALLTGCYPNRIGIAGALNSTAKHGINASETTIAEIFKSKGYITGIAGKWHLGHYPQFLPTKHGFDSWLGLPYSNDMWPLHPNGKSTHPPLPLFRNETVINVNVTAKDQETLSKIYMDRAIEFINNNKDKPFFFYLPFSMPHVPLYMREEYKNKSAYGPYGDVIQEIDESIGHILDTLKRHKLDENTIVIFATDNGPWLPYGNHGGTSGGLREGKGTVWEGGIRVPCIVRWPGVVPAGSVCTEPAMTTDILPTLAKIIGADLPKNKIDGLDIAPLWRNEANAKTPHQSFAFYYRDNQLQAVRSGNWKLVLPHTYPSMKGQTPGSNGRPGKAAQIRMERAELYNLATDVSESTDVFAKHPDVVAMLQKQAEAFRDDLGDSLTKRKGRNVREPGRLP